MAFSEKFKRKMLTFAVAMRSVYVDAEEIPELPRLELKEEELTEDFTAMLCAQMVLYNEVTGSDEDILGFIHILNRLAVQKLQENWNADGGKNRKEYGLEAERILDALDRCKAPVDWHEIDRPDIVQAIAAALAKIDRETAQEGEQDNEQKSE